MGGGSKNGSTGAEAAPLDRRSQASSPRLKDERRAHMLGNHRGFCGYGESVCRAFRGTRFEVRSKTSTASPKARLPPAPALLAETVVNIFDWFHGEWPDVVISSGRGSVAATLAIRRAANPRTFNIHIQSPYVHPSSFDVVVIPQHDSLRGSNVLVTKTALHRVTEVRLVEAAKKFSGRLSHLPRPLIAVLVGGSNKAEQCSPTVIKRLGELLFIRRASVWW